MNYKCPFHAMPELCTRSCRFYSEEPQKQTEDPDGPGSCVLAQSARMSIRSGAMAETRDNNMVRLIGLVERAAAKWGIK